MATKQLTGDKPNGPVAAALLAGGIASAVMGVVTTVSEAVPSVASRINIDNPVGPLSGKIAITLVAFAVSWIVLHLVFRGRDTDFTKVATTAIVLLVIGLIGTFPPFFELIAGS